MANAGKVKQRADQRRRRIVLLLTGTALTLAAVVWMAFGNWPVLPPDKIAQPAVTYSKTPVDSKFSISLEAPIDHPHDNKVQVTLVLINSGDSAVQLLSFTKGKRDYFQTGQCPAMQIALQPEITNPIPKNTSLLYTLQLQASASCSSEAQPISLHYKALILDATSPADLGKAKEVDGYISSGPLAPANEMHYAWTRIFILLSGLLHLFLAPVVLLFVGWQLSVELKNRDEEQARQARRRDERRKKEQDSRDRASEVIKAQLPGYRELVMSDYLPISRRMQTVEAEIPDEIRNAISGTGIAPLTAEQIDGLFCAILLFRARLLHFFTMKGGIYFRSYRAELLFRDLIGGFFDELRKKLGKEEFRQLVEMVGPEDTLAVATDKYRSGWTAGGQQFLFGRANSDLYAKTRARLLEWINTDRLTFRAHTRLLQIATEVLAFECDRPFYQSGVTSDGTLITEAWYFDPPIIQMTIDMYNIPVDIGKAGLYTALKKYWDNIPEKCREGCADPYHAQWPSH